MYTIRELQAGDAVALQDFTRVVTRETPFVTASSEINSFSLTQLNERLEALAASPIHYLIGAWSPTLLLGAVSLTPVGEQQWEIGLMLRRDYWGIGLAQALLTAAEAALPIGSEIILDVHVDNRRAQAFYQKQQFTMVSETVEARHEGQQSWDVYTMAKIIQGGSKDATT